MATVAHFGFDDEIFLVIVLHAARNGATASKLRIETIPHIDSVTCATVSPVVLTQVNGPVLVLCQVADIAPDGRRDGRSVRLQVIVRRGMDADTVSRCLVLLQVLLHLGAHEAVARCRLSDRLDSRHWVALSTATLSRLLLSLDISDNLDKRVNYLWLLFGLLKRRFKHFISLQHIGAFLAQVIKVCVP